MATTIVITIETDGTAFQQPEVETARILHKLAKDIAGGEIDMDGGRLFDLNGNPCGSIVLEEVED